MSLMTPTVYTPSTLAERWGCSERHVRNMIADGELPAFRLGGKLLRIRGDEVEKIECQNGASQGSEANTASLGPMPQQHQGGDVIALERPTKRKQPASPRLDTPNSIGRAGRR